MKYAFTFLLLCASTLLFGQSKITVNSAIDQKPVQGAKISCRGQALGLTDTEGHFFTKNKCGNFTIYAPNFEEIEIAAKPELNVKLQPQDKDIKSIESLNIEDKSDPRALKLLNLVDDHYMKNSPQSLPSYSYQSYRKISYDLAPESLADYRQFVTKRNDSLKNLPKPALSQEKAKDSLQNIAFSKALKESKYFLWERAEQHLYAKPVGEKIKVLDNRISGLENPVYELLALKSSFATLPKELKKENRNAYRFFLRDSLLLDGRPTYLIRYREITEKNDKNKRKYTGEIFVDKATFGVVKIESNSRKKDEGYRLSTWQFKFNKWFPDREILHFKFGSTAIENSTQQNKKAKKFDNFLDIKTYNFALQSPIEVSFKDFNAYSLTVEHADGSTLSKYRPEALDSREENTYVKIDSIGKSFNLDRKVSFLSHIIRGKIRVGKVDFDAAKLFGYNQYEGFRLGVGAKLNEKFNPYFSPDAYIAYGFKDRGFKYGIGADLKTSLEKNSFFRAEYFNEVQAAGRFSENQWSFLMHLSNSGVDLKNDKFFGFKGVKISYENDLTNGITLNISATKQEEKALFYYTFRNLGNDFQNFSTLVTLKFSPNSKNMMTPSGKYTYQQGFPELYLNYEQGLNFLGGDLKYSRVDALFNHVLKTKLGPTGIRLFGGFSTANTPIWHQFAINGLGGRNISGILSHFNLSSYLGFGTMQGGKYYNDRFVGYYLSQRIPFYFKTFGKNLSSFDVIYRGTIGDMSHPEYHNFQFEPLNHLYQEIGLECNNFLSTKFNLGFFYRVGHYQTTNFKENFAFQLKFSPLGF